VSGGCGSRAANGSVRPSAVVHLTSPDAGTGHSSIAYSMTSSARARIAGGISSPIARAVFRLMTSSSFVGC